jgi:outer membrane lipoprotein-sorting protein
MKKIILALLTAHLSLFTFAQDMTGLVNRVKAKLDLVNDYSADGILKTDVAFIKAPVSKIKMYYKKPNRFRLRKDGGISVLPKGGVSINMNNVVGIKDFVALASGEAIVDNVKTKVIKLLPADEKSDIVLSTLYIDEPNLLIRKAVTTTRENGTYEINMTYGKYMSYGLPDKIVFSFNAKDYKLPKGITLDFEEGAKPSELDKLKNKKGKVEITYTSYTINKGIDDALFNQ